jgi:hypothetical protein
VLYATDTRVVRYALEVEKCFLLNGFDVYLQTKLSDERKRATERVDLFFFFFFFVSHCSAHFRRHHLFLTSEKIKTDSLAEIISKSKSDALVVLGDRNIKNKSCQMRKKGKLIEMSVEETVLSCWQDWSEVLKEDEFLDRSKGDEKVRTSRRRYLVYISIYFFL